MKRILTEQRQNRPGVFSLIYRALGRVVAFVTSYIFSLMPRKDRVRVIVLSTDGKVLLVKGLFSRQQWSLLGGGLKRGESYEQAAKREVFEEVGLKIGSLKYVGRTYSSESYRQFPVRVYLARVGAIDEERLNIEILETTWACENELPIEYKLLYSKNNGIK